MISYLQDLYSSMNLFNKGYRTLSSDLDYLMMLNTTLKRIYGSSVTLNWLEIGETKTIRKVVRDVLRDKFELINGLSKASTSKLILDSTCSEVNRHINDIILNLFTETKKSL